MKIVIDRDIPYIRGALEPYADVHYISGDHISARDVFDANALIIRTRTKCGRELLEGSSVQLIATATIGYDHIDIEYCRMSGIDVVTAAGSNARGVLQWMGATLAYLSEQQDWEPAEKCIGIVGVGNVGSLIASYATLWGFDVLCCDPPRERTDTEGCQCNSSLYMPDEFVPFERIVSDCDIITFHTPLTKVGDYTTYHLADETFFRQVREGTVIINCARGPIVDTPELSNAVESGRCSCCIDTWEGEPDLDRRLLEDSLVATPHIAGYSAQGKANATSMAVNAVASKFGLPLDGWYPASDVPRVSQRPIKWEDLIGTIKNYCDIATETSTLKKNPQNFEVQRNEYQYRTEYF